ncbi:DUF3488 and transglutaminase-like domain-containing protein [Demequina sp.]|uniref:transglutaminase family protein n=1 Tax=Demequina sp. TaxID=2050685 RepID=UPI0025C60514|nr:DUF3488 and transglutaminase-like domain-containing protein [Demequina sp.]
MTSHGAAVRSPWYATPFVAIALLLGLNGFATMVVWGQWLYTVVGLVTAVTVLIIATRLLTRSRVLPTVVGALAALLMSVPAFARDEDGNAAVLPTPSALRDLARAVGDGVHEAATTVAPAQMTRPLVALVMVGVFAVFLAAEHLTVSWRAAAAAGIVLIAPWMPAVVLQHRVSTSALLGAIAAWVLLLALTPRHTGSVTSPSPWAAGSAVVATIALVAVVAPTALGANGWGAIPRFAAPTQLDGTSRLNLALDLRNSLTTNSSAPKIVYYTSGKRPDALRVYTLIDFDGSAWSRPPHDPSTRVPLGSAAQWPLPVAGWDSKKLDRVSVQVLSQAETNLPLPSVPRSVDVAGDWTYSPGLDEVTSDTTTTQDLSYAFEADFTYFSVDGLRALGAASEQDAQLGPDYVAIADAIDVDNVRTSAQAVVGDASTRYDQAVALQEFFRNTQDFTYDTSVAPSGDDSVSVFLKNRAGYCVQFASAMVVMSRSLGIPARLAIGFLPGERGADGESVITGADAHAWPELYFAGAGWVRFEPTPAVQTGARPAYADPAGVDSQTPINDFQGPRQGPTIAPSMAPITGGIPGATDAANDSAAPPWGLWVVVVMVLAGLAVGWRYVLSRRVTAARVDTPEHVWTWLRARLPRHYAWPDSLTPHESEAHLRHSLLTETVFLSADADRALTDVVIAVSDHRYAPEGSKRSVEELRDSARIVAAEIAATQSNGARGHPARADAPGAPRRDA